MSGGEYLTIRALFKPGLDTCHESPQPFRWVHFFYALVMLLLELSLGESTLAG